MFRGFRKFSSTINKNVYPTCSSLFKIRGYTGSPTCNFNSHSHRYPKSNYLPLNLRNRCVLINDLKNHKFLFHKFNIYEYKEKWKKYAVLLGLFGFLNAKKEVPDPESELISTIKRAVLLIQRDEFKGAEQMLHVALKLAQEHQNAEGITYIYDLLANLAFAQGQFGKAEKLFVNVMNRLLSGGVSEDDLKINHMSLKLAKIYEEQKDYKKAEEGYVFCLQNLQKHVDKTNAEDEDVLLLWAMSLDWYARFLLDRERMDEALVNFKKAYEMSLKINGEIHEQTVVLLNDLGTISFLKGDYDSAISYLTKAIEIGKHLPNMEDFSSVYVNLGNIYLQKRMYKEARKHCKEGWQNATRHKNAEGIHEANVCLEELTKMMS